MYFKMQGDGNPVSVLRSDMMPPRQLDRYVFFLPLIPHFFYNYLSQSRQFFPQ